MILHHDRNPDYPTPIFLHFTFLLPALSVTDLGDGKSGPVDLLSLQSSLGPGLDHMGTEEGSEGPKFSPIGILIVRWWAQLCQNRGTVFLQRRQKTKNKKSHVERGLELLEA